MSLREQSALVVAIAGLALLAGSAGAQTPYTYPQGGYRGVEGPDGVMTRAPDADRRAYPANQGSGPDSVPYPVEPRAGGQPLQPSIAAPEPYPEPQIVRRPPGYNPSDAAPSGYGAMPPYDDRTGARPDATPPGIRPPSDVPNPGVAATTPGAPANLAALPPEDQPETGEPKELPPQFRRQIVDYQTKEPAGTIIIDTPSTFLYLVNGDGTALRYGIGVGREGFTWAGTERITRMAEWPDWHPPAEMIERQPYLPRFMAGGPGNPMGARALYLGKTIYRVHGTNQPSTIGQFVSSGCIRMLNEDVEDLYSRVKVGAKVVVLGGARGPSASNASATR